MVAVGNKTQLYGIRRADFQQPQQTIRCYGLQPLSIYIFPIALYRFVTLNTRVPPFT